LSSGDFVLVRRPTGGGAVVHTPYELTYALAVSRAWGPGSIRLGEIPYTIHVNLRDRLVSEGIPTEDLTVSEAGSQGPVALCFEAPVRGDLLYKGRKSAGSALRVWREGFLIQGSVQGIPISFQRLAGILIQAVRRTFGLSDSADS